MTLSPNQFRRALADVLKRRGFESADDIADAVTPGHRRYVVGESKRKVNVRAASHADFQADALIHDGEIGSLGLVHFLVRADEAQVRKAIDDAAYLCHLLLEDARAGASAATPYAVEVVLAANGSDEETATAIGEVLNDVLREGSYLHAVGVNVWIIGDASTERRAFSWLLTETKEWLGRRAATAPAADPLALVEAVTLTDVRVAGERAFHLGGGHQLHLIHGYNGSGKSSFCEALELVMTSRVARLKDQNHRDCLTSRDASNGGARIAIQRDGGLAPQTWTVAPDGVPDALKPALNADAFRLDQSVADRLIQGSAAERARIFLDAFFPDDATASLEKHRNEARETFEKFLPKVARKLSGDAEPSLDNAIKLASEKLHWLDRPLWKEFLQLMPLDRQLVHALGAILPADATERYERAGLATENELAAAAQAIDAAFRVMGNDLKTMMEVAGQSSALLSELANVTVSGPGDDDGDDLETRMSTWQQLHAHTDILERETQLRAAIQAACSTGHKFRGPMPVLAVSDAPGPSEKDIAALREARDVARRAVLAFESESERRAKRERRADLPNLDRADILSSAAAFGIFGAPYRNTTPALGEAVRTALRTGRPVPVLNGSSVLVSVGESGWTAELSELARKTQDVLTRVDQRRDELPTATRPLENFTTHLRTFRKAAAQIELFDQSAVERFADVFKADAPLGRAVNEFTALLTPARWKYDDVIPTVDVTGADHQVELYAGGTSISAKFILNTAELNTLALAIFLLCARRIDNPLRIVVLDDPLQNMDELTVTTIARGIRRMLRLWKHHLDAAGSPWRIFMLLHGEDDMERTRREVPCVVHFLPWLSPRASGGRNELSVETQAPLLSEELQPLSRVLTQPAL